MSAEVINSYLVSLGFEVSQPELRKFQLALRDASGFVEGNTAGMVKNMLAWQFAIVGAFTSVGVATLGIMDKVAQADQEYRLFALHNLMNVDAAKKMTIALDALGVSLDDVTWDPELRGRFNELWELQSKLESSNGDEYKQRMKDIRDVRFQLTELQVSGQYLLMNVVSSLAKALSGDSGDAMEKVKGWIQYITDHGPELSDQIANFIVPIFREWVGVMKDLYGVGYEAAGAFQELSALLTGDDALEGAPVSFANMAKAVRDDAEAISDLIHVLTQYETAIGHIGKAGIGFASGIWKWAHGDYDAADSALDRAANETVKGVHGAVRAFQGYNADGSDPLAGSPSRQGSSGDIDALIQAAAMKYGVRPSLVRAVAQQESGERQRDASGKLITSRVGAIGIMQLMPTTAARLGVDPTDASQNVDGGVQLLASLLKKYKNTAAALAAYNWGEGNFDRAVAQHGRLPMETQQYVRAITGQTIDMSGMTIHVTKSDASADDIARKVREQVEGALNWNTQTNLANNAGAY